jgi:hypothetical protein
MALAEDTVRNIASRYGGSGVEEAPAEEPAALRAAGEAMAAIDRGDRSAFLSAVRAMLEPDDEPRISEVDELPGVPDFDPDLMPPE